MSEAKILVIYGTRPELIKIAPVIIEFRRKKQSARLLIINTGQHKDLLPPLEDFFGIMPDYRLGVCNTEGSLSLLFAETLVALQKCLSDILKQHTVAYLVAQGDTNVVLVSAVCAYFNKLKFAHIEAGLRTFDLMNPYPEEFNRICAAHAASIHFAPSPAAVRNLLAEGIDKKTIIYAGNTIVDSLKFAWRKARRLHKEINQNKKLVLITCHRRENQGLRRLELLKALAGLCRIKTDYQFLWLIHPNAMADLQQLCTLPANLDFIPPVDYPQMITLYKGTSLIITDSGGIQEEAFVLNIPVILTREKTERPDGIRGYDYIIYNPLRDKLPEKFDKLMETAKTRSKAGRTDHGASKKITQRLLKFRNEL